MSDVPDGLPEKLELKKKNKCFIFSNRFDTDETEEHALSGHKLDEEIIATTFSWLNFDIFLELDLEKIDLVDRIGDLANENYEDCECVVLFFLSHGTKDDKHDKEMLITADGQKTNIETIVNKFINSKLLAGKPKLFFFQACRGRKKGETTIATRAAGTETESIAKKADVFIFYSTTKDNQSYLEEGGFFIDKLCAVLQKYGRMSDLNTMVTIVNYLLSRHIQYEEDDEDKASPYVQVSEVRHTLTCNLFFTPKEENYTEFEKSFKKSNEYDALKDEGGWGKEVESDA